MMSYQPEGLCRKALQSHGRATKFTKKAALLKSNEKFLCKKMIQQKKSFWKKINTFFEALRKNIFFYNWGGGLAITFCGEKNVCSPKGSRFASGLPCRLPCRLSCRLPCRPAFGLQTGLSVAARRLCGRGLARAVWHFIARRKKSALYRPHVARVTY